MALGNLGDAFINIRPKFAGFTGALKGGVNTVIQDAVFDLGESMEEAGKKLLTKFALPLGIAIAANLAAWQNLDAAIRETATLFGSGGTAAFNKQFDEMRDGIIAVSAEVGVLEEQIAEGLYQAISAGVPRDNVFEFISVAQKAAIAGATTTEISVDALTTAVNAFSGLRGPAQAADILFATVSRGKTTLEELAASMARAAPIASAAGVSFEEFNAIVATMTLQGTPTAEAFTNIKAALTGLLRPSEDMNKLWEEAGIISGEVAVRTLGLQGAMTILSDATGGSIGAMSSLLGGMEAVNAVVQVTGDNAAVFATSLDNITNSAGMSNQAFGIMNEGTGRIFGAFTASLDRLGNAGGDLVDDFINPVVKGLTGAIDTFGDWTRVIGDAFEPMAAGWKSLVEVITGNAVFRGAIATLGVFVTSVYAVGAGLGIMLLTLGKVLTLAVTILRFKFYTKILSSFAKHSRAVGDSLFYMGERMKAGNFATRGLKKAMQKLGTVFDVAKGSKWLTPSPWILLSVAVVAVGAAYIYLKGKQDDVIKAMQISTDGAAELADSMGLVTRNIDEIPDNKLTSIEFRVKNMEQLSLIEDAFATDKVAGGNDLLFTIATNMVYMGNTPEDVMKAIRKINRESIQIDIDFNADDLGDLDRMVGIIQAKIDILLENMAHLADNKSGSNVAGGRRIINTVLDFFDGAEIEGLEKNIASQISTMFQAEGGEAKALTLLEDMNDQAISLGINARELNFRFLDEIDGESNFLSNSDKWLRKVKPTMEELREILESRALIDPPDIGLPTGSQRAGVNDPPPLYTNTGLTEMTEELQAGFTANKTYLDGTTAAWEEHRERVNAAQQAIIDKYMAMLPGLAVYADTVETTFGDWKDGQVLFREQLAIWEENKGELERLLTPAVFEATMAGASLAQKAQFAGLRGVALEEFVTEATATFDALQQAATDEDAIEIPAFTMASLDDFYAEVEVLRKAMEESGGTIATDFADAFADAADSWPGMVRYYANLSIQAMLDAYGIKSPSTVMIGIANNLADSFANVIKQRTLDFAVPLPRTVEGAEGSGGIVINVNSPVTSDLRSDIIRGVGLVHIVRQL